MMKRLSQATDAASAHSVFGRSSAIALLAVMFAVLGGFAAYPVRAAYPSTTASCTPGVWNQESANVLPAMKNGYLFAATVASPTLAWAVGEYFTGTSYGSLIEKWTGGTTWSVVGNGGPGAQLEAVASFGASDAVAVGNVLVSNNPRALVSRWNGSKWGRTVLPLPTKATRAYLFQVSGSSAKDVWASGSYVIGKENHVLLEHFNGSTWTRAVLPSSDQTLAVVSGILDIAPNDVWATGVADTSGTLRMWHYTGSAWTLQATSPPAAGPMTGSADNDRWITGFNVMEHWNGTQWVQVGTPNANTQLLDAAEGAHRALSLWSVGWTFGSSAHVYIAKNGVQVSTPSLSGFLNGIGTGFGLAFAVGYPSTSNPQPIVLASCD